MAITISYFKNDTKESTVFIPTQLSYKKFEKNVPLKNSPSNETLIPTSLFGFDNLRSKRDIYEISINSPNIKNLVDILLDYTESYKENVKLYITNGEVSFDAYISSYQISDEQITIKLLSDFISIGTPVIPDDNIIHNISCKTKIPNSIKFYKYGNYIIVDCETKILVTNEEYNNIVEQYNSQLEQKESNPEFVITINLDDYIPVSCDSALSTTKKNRCIVLEFTPNDQYDFIDINIGKAVVTCYTNLPSLFTDVIIQKIGYLSYKIDFRTHNSAKRSAIYCEIYKVENDTEKFYTSFTGYSSTLSLEPGFYRIYKKIYIGTFDLTFSDYVEFKVIGNKYILQFNTSTVIESGEYVEVTAFDDCIIEIEGLDSYEINAYETKRLYFNKAGKFICNVYSKTSNAYVSNFVVISLGKQIDYSYIDIIADEHPIYGKPIRLRIDSVNLDVDEYNIELSGDIEVIEKISNSEFIVKFTKINSASVIVMDVDNNNILLSKLYNVGFGTYKFGVKPSTDGFYITSPFDCFIQCDHFTKSIDKNTPTFVECFTTGKLQLTIEFLIGNKTVTKKYILDLDCENGKIHNPYNRTLYFVHPNSHNISDYEWYVNGNLYMIGTNQINITPNYNNTINVDVVYYVNGRKYLYSETITMKPFSVLSCKFKVDFSLHDNGNNVSSIIHGSPTISMKTVGTTTPMIEFIYIKNKKNISFENFYYIGDDVFILDKIDNIKITDEVI